VQWMGRLLFSAVLCVPAIFMLIAGAWDDRPNVSPGRYDSAYQLHSAANTPLTISLPRSEADPIVAVPDQPKMALDVPASANTPPLRPQRTHSQHPKVELWYAATPKQEAPTFLHWRMTTRPGVWIPGPNQDSGG
jgi:hypothetical protein